MINSKVIGQSLLLDRLNSMISGGRVAHAYLLKGPKGIGKTTIGERFAKMLLCKSFGKRPCNSCQSCIQFESRNHPDYKYIEPRGKSIRIDQIREFRQDIAIKPYQGGKKIYMIDDCHTMTQQAQNALLKTLEEPPGYAIIILGTDNVHALLPTIISRCQTIPIRRLTSSDICEILKSRGIAMDEAEVFAHMSAGIPGRAIDISLDEKFKVLREITIDYIDNIFNMRCGELLKNTDLFMDNRESIDIILELLVLFMRDVLIYVETGDKNLVMNRDKIPIISLYSNSLTRGQIRTAIENIETAQRMLDNNANYQLTIENMLLAINGGVELCS